MNGDSEIAKRDDAPLAAEPAMPTFADIVKAATNRELSAEQVEKFLGVYERLETARQERLFNAALVEFQAACPMIKALHQTSQYTRVTRQGIQKPGCYAAEDDIRPVVNPIMARCGLTIIFTGHEFDSEGRYVLFYELRHREGFVLRGKGPPIALSQAVVSKLGRTVQSPSQVSAATNTYARRQTTINALSITTTDDLDGVEEGSAGDYYVSEQQAAEIEGLLTQIEPEDKREATRSRLLKYAGATVLAECPSAKFDEIMRRLRAQVAKQQNEPKHETKDTHHG